jgi:nucleotide-binding universal stress UspA family protein
VTAEIKTIDQGHEEVGQALIWAAGRFGADLIVAGAFSHLRLRERVLGGVTHGLMGACDKPVLFSH